MALCYCSVSSVCAESPSWRLQTRPCSVLSSPLSLFGDGMSLWLCLQSSLFANNHCLMGNGGHVEGVFLCVVDVFVVDMAVNIYIKKLFSLHSFPLLVILT